MELGESRRWLARLRRGLLAGACAAALVAAGTSGVWADQANDNSTTTNAAGDAPIVAPVTGAVQVNLACPANVNVLGSQDGSGGCAPGAQANDNSSATTVGGDHSPGLVGGTLIAPITAAAQLDVSCPVNVNVLSRQRDSGSCAPGPQTNSNSAATRVRGSGAVPGLLGGPLVAPVTTGVGLDVTCPTNVNVLSEQRASGDCLDAASPGGPPGTPPPGTSTETAPAGGTASGAAPTGASPAETYTAEVVSTGFSQPPGPPVTGALAIGGTPAGFPALGALVLAVLAAAAMAVRRLQQER